MLGLGDDRVRLVDLLVLHGDRLGAQLQPPLRFCLCVLRIGFGLLNRCLGEIDGDLVVGRVDRHQHVALAHELVVGDRQLDDRPATSGAIVTT